MLLEFCLEYASIPHWIYLFLKYISLIILLQLSILFLLDPSTWYPDFLRQSLLSSFLCVAHVSSLTSPFPILFLTPPCLFCTYQFVLLNPWTFSPIVPSPLPADNPPNDLHIYDTGSVLLVFFVCVLNSVVDSCEFIVILMFLVLTFFFLNKSL